MRTMRFSTGCRGYMDQVLLHFPVLMAAPGWGGTSAKAVAARQPVSIWPGRLARPEPSRSYGFEGWGRTPVGATTNVRSPYVREGTFVRTLPRSV